MLPLHRGDLSYKDHPAESQTSFAKLTRFVKIEFQVHPFRTLFIGFGLVTFLFVMLSAGNDASPSSNPPWFQGDGAAAGKYQNRGNNYYQKEMWRVEEKNIVIDEKDLEDEVIEETQTFPDHDEDDNEEGNRRKEDANGEVDDHHVADEAKINLKNNHKKIKENANQLRIEEEVENDNEDNRDDGDDDDENDDNGDGNDNDDDGPEDENGAQEDIVIERRRLGDLKGRLAERRQLDLDKLHKLGRQELENVQNEIRKAIENVPAGDHLLQEVQNKLREEQAANPKDDIIHLQPKLEDQKYAPIGEAEVNARRLAIKETFRSAWKSYKDAAFGADELNTDTCKPAQDWMGMGLTIVDGIDGLWLMGLEEEFKDARDWIADKINFDQDRSVSFFETTIRILGGLLSAYDLSKDRIFVDKAVLLADRLLFAFNTTTGIPHASVNLRTGHSQSPGWAGGASILSEIGTVQLEFNYLSHVTKNPVYAEKALQVFDRLDKATKKDGLYPIYVSTVSGAFTSNFITMGAMGDSFYEYQLKLYLQTRDEKYLRMYNESTQGIMRHLLKRSSPSGLLHFCDFDGKIQTPKMDHLACFAGAMFSLGSKLFPGNEKSHMEVAEGITATCHEFYRRQPTGLSPDYVRFGANDFAPGAKFYVLRPETFESYFYLWRTTHDPKYREWGWQAFQAIEKHCKSECGYSGIRDVSIIPAPKDDKMQSFFFAETLKYLYLLYSPDDFIPLDQYVINTEGHPLHIFSAETA